MRYFLELSYFGNSYHGWQRQKTASSIQQFIEEALFTLLRKHTNCVGCGRTDTGVHASQYYAHIDIDEMPNFDLVRRLNSLLPNDIVVHQLLKVGNNAHAQHDAKNRQYDYFIHWEKDPFLSGFSSEYHGPVLDFRRMGEFVYYLEKQNDFRSLCKQPEIYNTTICEIRSLKLYTNEKKNRLRLQINSNRFLRSMMRLITAKMIQIGNGQLSLDDFKSVFEKQIHEQHMVPFYPDGLYLTSVEYEYLPKKVSVVHNPHLGFGMEGWRQLL